MDDMKAWKEENDAFLAKIGQVVTPKAKPTTTKDEE